MYFYFIAENNNSGIVEGSNINIVDDLTVLCTAQARHTGFVGAIDKNGRLRGTFAWSNFLNHRNKLYTFVRKYQAMEVLEHLAQEIQTNISR